MRISVSNRQVYFLVGVFVFFFGSFFLSVWLVVGAGFGAVGMFFLVRWYEPFVLARKKRLYEQKRLEVERLRKDLFG